MAAIGRAFAGHLRPRARMRSQHLHFSNEEISARKEKYAARPAAVKREPEARAGTRPGIFYEEELCSEPFRAARLYAGTGGGAGVSPWRRMISIILARSGGPPAEAFIASALSRKNCGPIAAGVTMHNTFAS